MDIYPPAVQRPALKTLAAVIDCRAAALRRDDCGDWYLLGKAGHIYAVPEGFQIVVMTETVRLWSVAKDFLKFANLTQDGDSEGVFILDRLPTATEAALIRRVIGLKKRKTMAPEHIQKLRDGLLRVGLAA